MSAVAMATPGITFHFFVLDTAIIPASHPNRAMSTSYIVGEVRANISD